MEVIILFKLVLHLSSFNCCSPVIKKGKVLDIIIIIIIVIIIIIIIIIIIVIIIIIIIEGKSKQRNGSKETRLKTSRITNWVILSNFFIIYFFIPAFNLSRPSRSSVYFCFAQEIKLVKVEVLVESRFFLTLSFFFFFI